MTTFTSDRLVEKKGTRRFLPSLENGDHLTQTEFSEIYRQRPDIKKAELIEGVVFMVSPVSLFHGSPHMRFSGLLVQYAANTPGLEMADNTSRIYWMQIMKCSPIFAFGFERVERYKSQRRARSSARRNWLSKLLTRVLQLICTKNSARTSGMGCKNMWCSR